MAAGSGNNGAIIFIDELDAVGTKRFDSELSGDREVTQDEQDTGARDAHVDSCNRPPTHPPPLVPPSFSPASSCCSVWTSSADPHGGAQRTTTMGKT